MSERRSVKRCAEAEPDTETPSTSSGPLKRAKKASDIARDREYAYLLGTTPPYKILVQLTWRDYQQDLKDLRDNFKYVGKGDSGLLIQPRSHGKSKNTFWWVVYIWALYKKTERPLFSDINFEELTREDDQPLESASANPADEEEHKWRAEFWTWFSNHLHSLDRDVQIEVRDCLLPHLKVKKDDDAAKALDDINDQELIRAFNKIDIGTMD